MKKAITNDIEQVLSKIAVWFTNKVWGISWSSRKQNILVLNVVGLFLFTIESVASVRKK